jgi:hypothetical protein
MAIQFPSSPALNDTVTSGSTTWTWNGSSWEATELDNVFFDLVTVSLTTTSANQQLDSTEATAIKFMVRADDGSNADATEIMALLDGTTVNFVEYGRVGTSGTDLAEYSVDQSSGSIILRATPASANTTFHISKTLIKA